MTTQDKLLEACLAYFAGQLGDVTPTTGPCVRVMGPGTPCMRWFLYADDAMMKSIGVIEVRLSSWK